MPIKKVLITGSNGLLGQKLTDIYLKRSDVEFLATGRGENRHHINLGSKYRSMDIANENQVQKVISDFGPDTIIHCAAMTNVDACELDHQQCDLLNVDAVNYVANAAEKARAHLIHLSTDFIFDGEDGPYKEDDAPNPVSYYGESKLKAEKIVQETCSKWAIARTALVYGVSNDMSRSNIVLWAKSSLEQHKPINVVDDQFRSPTLAEDLASGCELIEKNNATGVFNISGKDFLNIYEIVEKVAEVYGLSMDSVTKIKSETLGQPAKRPPVTGFDLTKSNRILGYKPHSLEEGIKIVVEQTAKRDATL